MASGKKNCPVPKFKALVSPFLDGDKFGYPPSADKLIIP
jgi:hypothetical protein